MGRPLNKRYFGNVTLPPAYGSSVSGVEIRGLNDNYTSVPALSVPAPDLAGGVQATLAVNYMIAKSVIVATVGTGGSYNIGNVLTITGTAAPTFNVNSIVTRSIAIAAGGANYQAGTAINFSGTGWTTGLVITVDTVDAGGAILTASISTPGVRSQVAPANPVGGTSAVGTGATFNISWGVNSVAIVDQGQITAIPANPVATTVGSGTGTGARLTISWGIGAINVTVAGSGYDAAPVVTQVPAGNAVLTSSVAGMITPSIVAMAVFEDGVAPASGDIIKQTSSRRYLIDIAGVRKICKLVTYEPVSAGEVKFTALDANGNSYYVDKITARRVKLVQVAGGANYVFEDNSFASWTFNTPTANQVQIVNA